MNKKILRQNKTCTNLRPNLSHMVMKKALNKPDTQKNIKPTKINKKISQDQQLKKLLFKQNIDQNKNKCTDQKKQASLREKSNMTESKLIETKSYNNCQQKINICIQNIEKNNQKAPVSQNNSTCLSQSSKMLTPPKKNSQLQCQQDKICIGSMAVNVSPQESYRNQKCQQDRICLGGMGKRLNPKSRSRTELNKSNLSKSTQSESAQRKNINKSNKPKQTINPQKKQKQLLQNKSQIKTEKKECQNMQVCPNGKEQLKTIPEQTLKQTLKESEFHQLSNMGKNSHLNLIIKGKGINTSNKNILENKSLCQFGLQSGVKQNKCQNTLKPERKSDKKCQNKIEKKSLKDPKIKEGLNKNNIIENKSCINLNRKCQKNQGKQMSKISLKKTQAKKPLNDAKIN